MSHVHFGLLGLRNVSANTSRQFAHRQRTAPEGDMEQADLRPGNRRCCHRSTLGKSPISFARLKNEKIGVANRPNYAHDCRAESFGKPPGR